MAEVHLRWKPDAGVADGQDDVSAGAACSAMVISSILVAGKAYFRLFESSSLTISCLQERRSASLSRPARLGCSG